MLKPKLKKQFEELCLKIYPERITAGLIEEEQELKTFLRKNRLDHFFSLTYKTNPELIKEYNHYKKNIIQALKILKRSLDYEDFIVIKTFSNYPHITSDLDILVKSKDLVIKNKNIKLPIAWDINHKISWTNDEEMSHDFIWKNIKHFNFGGVKIIVPNSDLDTLIRLAHLPFEQAEIRLGELLHIFAETKKVDWHKIEKEAEKNNWLKTFKRTKKFINNLHQNLCQKKELIEFPSRLPAWQLAAAVIEKKAWFKISGARYVIKDRFFSKK